MLEGLQDTLKDAVQNAGEAAQEAGKAAKGTQGKLAREVAKRAAQLGAQQARVLDAQNRRIRDLEVQVNTLSRRRGGGGFPLFPLLLIGGAVYLYRTNPTVKDRVNGLLDRVNPGIKGNLTRAGDAAKDAVQSVMHGDNPKGAAQDALGELKRGGEKAVDQAQDKAHDLKQDAQKAVDQAQNKAQDLKQDAQRAADRAQDDWRSK